MYLFRLELPFLNKRTSNRSHAFGEKKQNSLLAHQNTTLANHSNQRNLISYEDDGRGRQRNVESVANSHPTQLSGIKKRPWANIYMKNKQSESIDDKRDEKMDGQNQMPRKSSSGANNKFLIRSSRTQRYIC